MTFRQYLALMIASTAVCWFGWFSVVRLIDPASAGLLGFALFYASLSLALIGTFAIIGLAGRAAVRPQEPAARHVSASFRQSLLFTTLLTGSLMLQSRSMLNWWNLLFFVGALTILELFLVSWRPQ